MNTIENSIFKKGEKPYRINEQVRSALAKLGLNELDRLEDLSESDYKKIYQITPKIDKISKKVIVKVAFSLLQFEEFKSYTDKNEKDRIDLNSKDDIFATNGETVSVLKGCNGIFVMASIAGLQPCYSTAKIEATDSSPLIYSYDRFFDQLFGKCYIPRNIPKELEKLAYKWYDDHTNKKDIDLSAINVNVPSKLGVAYSRLVKYLFNQYKNTYKTVIVKAISGTPLKRFIYEKFHSEGVKMIPCKKASFALGPSLKAIVKNRLDLDKIEEVQERISQIQDYKIAKEAQINLIKDVSKENETLVKMIVKRSNISPIMDGIKVKKTRDQIIVDNNYAYLHRTAIELFAIPYNEKFVNSLIGGMTIKGEKLFISENYLKKIPQKVLDEVTKILKIDSVKSEVDEQPEKLVFNTINSDKYFVEQNDIKDEEN